MAETLLLLQILIMRINVAGVFILMGLSVLAAVEGRNVLKLPSETSRFFDDAADDSVGTRWAVLLAGSSGYWNYRHQVVILRFRNAII